MEGAKNHSENRYGPGGSQESPSGFAKLAKGAGLKDPVSQEFADSNPVHRIEHIRLY